MHDKFFKQFTESSHSVQLTQAEKDHVRNKLLQFAVRTGVTEKAPVRFSIFKRWVAYVSVPLVVVLGAGVTYASESSLPGDFLYPVKVNVVEKVKTSFAFSPEQKAQVGVQLAENRISEAEQLVARGNLNADARVFLSEAIRIHTQNFQDEIRRLNEVDADAAAEATSQFQAALRIHEQVLAALDNQNGLLPGLEAQRSALANLQTQMQQQMAPKMGAMVRGATDIRVQQAQRNLDDVRIFLDQVNTDANLKARAEARFQEAQNFYDQGKSQFDAGNYDDAFRLFQSSREAAQEVRALVETNNRLPPEVRIRIFPDGQRREETKVQDNSTPGNVDIRTETKTDETHQSDGLSTQQKTDEVEQRQVRDESLQSGGSVHVDVQSNASSSANSSVRINTR